MDTVAACSDTAPFDDALAGGTQGWVDVFGTGFGFVHGELTTDNADGTDSIHLMRNRLVF